MDYLRPAIRLAAITAWPSANPPSFVGTWECVKTSNPDFFNIRDKWASKK